MGNVKSKKLNLHYTRGIMPKGVTEASSGGAHLRCLAPGQHRSKEIFTTVASHLRHHADLTGPGIEPQTARTDGVRLTTELTGWCCEKCCVMKIISSSIKLNTKFMGST